MAEVPVLQGLGDQQLPKHFHYEILFVIQPVKRDFGERLWVLVKEKRKPLQDQMSNVGSNPRRKFDCCLVILLDQGTQTR